MNENEEHSPFGSDAERIAAIRRTRAAIEYAPGIDGPKIAEEAVRAYWNARSNPQPVQETSVALVDRLAARLAQLETVVIHAREVGRIGRPWGEIALDAAWAIAPAILFPLAVILLSPGIRLFPLPDEIVLAQFGGGMLANVRWDLVVGIGLACVALGATVGVARSASRRPMFRYRLQHSGGAFAAGVLLAIVGTGYLALSSKQADTVLDVDRAQSVITDQIVKSMRSYRDTGRFAPVPTDDYSRFALRAEMIDRNRAVYACFIPGANDEWEANVTPFSAQLHLRRAAKTMGAMDKNAATRTAVTEVLLGKITETRPSTIVLTTPDGQKRELAALYTTGLSIGSDAIAVVERGQAAIRMIRLREPALKRK